MTFRISTTTKLKLIYLMLGMMFWYGIESFMDNVLRDPNARALTTLAYTAALLLFDIPGGIFADKYGRRTALLTGNILQFISLVFLATSHQTWTYVLGAFVFGIYWSLCNGAVQAFMYDHLHNQNRAKEYAQHQGSVYAFGYLGAGVANVLSGIIADASTLRLPYMLSLIPSLLSLGLVLSLREPKNKAQSGEQEQQKPKLKAYLQAWIKAVRLHPLVLIFSAQIIITYLVFMTICEFGQVFLLSYGISATELGLLWAVDAAVVALALHYAHYLQRFPLQSTFVAVPILVLFGVLTGPIGILLFMLVYASMEVIHNIAETEIQHRTARNVRATVLSSTFFIGNAISLPGIWLFNTLLQKHGIFSANTFAGLLAALLLCMTGIALIARRRTAKNR